MIAIRFSIIAFLMAALPMSLTANVEPPLIVSVTQVVHAALAYNNGLKAAAAGVAAAAAVQNQAKAALLPSLDADGRAARYVGLQDTQMGQNFVIPAVAGRYAAGIGLTQPLYTGDRLASRKRMTATQQQGARADWRANKADVIHRALTAYWSWAKAFHAVQSYQAATAWMEAHVADVRNLRQAGLATENDLVSTSVRLDQTRLKLEKARHHVSLTRAALACMIGYELPTASEPQAAAENEPQPGDEAECIARALAGRDELQSRRLAVAALQENIAIQRAGYFPQLYAGAHYEIGRPNQLDIPPEDRWNDDAYVALSASWNLLDWGLTRAKVYEARARLEQARHLENQLADQIVFEVRQALINLENALVRLRVARSAESGAELDLKTVSDLWRNDMARHSEVLDAQARLTDARFEKICAGADAILSQADLDHATGALTGQFEPASDPTTRRE